MRRGARRSLIHLAPYFVVVAAFFATVAPLEGQVLGKEPPEEKVKRLEELYRAGDPEVLILGRELREEARKRLTDNSPWKGKAAAYYGLALVDFGDFEEGEDVLIEAMSRLESGELLDDVKEAYEWGVRRSQIEVVAWREHYAGLVDAVRKALSTGEEPPVITKSSGDLDMIDPMMDHEMMGGPTFRVVEVVSEDSTGAVVRIDATPIDLLRLGMAGVLHCGSPEQERSPDGEARPIGTAKVITEGDRPSIRVDYHDELKGSHSIDQWADYVRFGSHLPYRYEGHPSIFQHLSIENIGIYFFSRADMVNHYDIGWARILGDSVPPVLTAVRMAREIREDAARNRAQPPQVRWPELDGVVLRKGKFAGLTILEAMERTTLEEVNEFLYYVIEFQGPGLRGTDWPVMSLYISFLRARYEDDD